MDERKPVDTTTLPEGLSLKALYDDAGRPYGSSEAGFDRWCEEQEATIFGAVRDDPRRARPEPNRRVEPR